MIFKFVVPIFIIFHLTLVYSDCQFPPTCQDYCNFNGIYFNSTGDCLCDKGYVTRNPINYHQQCNYQQKEQLIAFLLQFFVGYTGAADFYTENTGIAVAKLVLLLWIIGGSCFMSCCLGFIKKVIIVYILTILIYLSHAVIAVWWLADTIRYGINEVPDGNGVKLKSW